jgi:hypothetical protein
MVSFRPRRGYSIVLLSNGAMRKKDSQEKQKTEGGAVFHG